MTDDDDEEEEKDDDNDDDDDDLVARSASDNLNGFGDSLYLTFSILRLYFRPKREGAKIFGNHLNPVMLVCIGVLSDEYPCLPGFPSFSSFFASFSIGKISHQQH